MTDPARKPDPWLWIAAGITVLVLIIGMISIGVLIISL